MLCTLAEVKALLGIAAADTASDAVLTSIVLAVSDRLAREAGRDVGGVACLELANVVEFFDIPDCDVVRTLFLTARPVAAISEVKEAVLGDYESADELVEGDDWYLQPAWGRLTRIGTWMWGDQAVRVTYTGGYVHALPWVSGTTYAVGDMVTHLGVVYESKSAFTSTTAPPADPTHWTTRDTYTALPRELADAAARQSAFQFQRLSKLGLTSESIAGASLQTYARDDLLPDVKHVVNRYARITG